MANDLNQSRDPAPAIVESDVPDGPANEQIGTNFGLMERALDEILALGGRNPSRWVTLARQLLSFDKLDNVLAAVRTGERSERLTALAQALDIRYVFNGLENLKNVRDQPVIVFGNHPIGSGNVLGICLLLARRFSDHRIIGHRYMKFIPSLADKMIPVDPFRSTSSMNLEALVRLRREFGTQYQALGVFPAGNSSQLKMSGVISDRRWSDAFIRIARHHDALLVPVWFSGRNRLRYYIASKIRAELGFLALPAEFLRLSGKSIIVNIGKPISANLLNSISGRDARLSFLRASVYDLEPKRVARAGAKYVDHRSRATSNRCVLERMSVDQHLELRFFESAAARQIPEFGNFAENDLSDITVHVVLTPRDRMLPLARWQMLDWGKFTPGELEHFSPIRRAFRLPGDVARSASTWLEIVAFSAGDQCGSSASLKQIYTGLRQSLALSNRATDLIGLVSPLESSFVLVGLQFAMLQKAQGDAALLRASAKLDVIGATPHHDWRPHRDIISFDKPIIRRQMRSIDPLLRALTAIGVRFGAAGLSSDAAPRACVLGRLTTKSRPQDMC